MGISEQPGLVSNRTAQVACGGGEETLLHVTKPSTTFFTDVLLRPTSHTLFPRKTANPLDSFVYVLMHGKTFSCDNLISDKLIKGVMTFPMKSGCWE